MIDDRSAAFGDDQPIPDAAIPIAALERAARESPARIAVRFGRREVAYDELDVMATALAARLLDDQASLAPVAVCLPRSIELVAALYGINKCGLAFLPLDVEGPARRVGILLAAARVETVVTSRELAPLFDAKAVKLVFVEDTSWTRAPRAKLPPFTDERAAYVIFTSGSTGTPKGVAISHRSLWNRLDWMQRAYPLGATDRVAQKTPSTFDVSVWEFFWPLMYGASIAVVPPGAHKDPDRLAAAIGAHAVTIAHFVPSMLNEFLRFDVRERCRTLRTVFASGEALTYGLIDRFFEGLPGVKLVNLYGPTEATIDVTHWECSGPRTAPTPPIGKPIQNTRCFILRGDRSLAVAGEVGDLHVSGAGLAIGYLNDPIRTAESFFANPYADDDPMHFRLYRTGDRGRLLPDGNIEYLGRDDDQVKLRGLRIELREIDHALEDSDLVTAAATIVRSDQLVAFVEARRRGPHDVERELRAELRARLPAYMIPQRIIATPRLPRTAAGKVDRRALADWEIPVPAEAPSAPELPETPSAIENELRAVWADVLRCSPDAIRRAHSFFEHGGDSLSMLRVIARAKARGLRFTLADFDAHPYLPALSARARRERIPAPAPPAPPAEPGRRARVTPLQASMLRYALEYADFGRYVLARRVSFGPGVDLRSLERAVRLVAERHEVLRSTYVRGADDTFVRVCREASAVPFSVVAGVPRLDTVFAGFEEEPPLRFFATAAEGDLTIVAHHVAFDGRSLELVIDELVTAYEALRAGGDPSRALPPAPAFSEYERWIHSRDSAAAERDWRARLDGFCATRFVAQPSRRAHSGFGEAVERVVVSGALRQSLASRSISLSTALNGAFALVLARFHGARRVLWGNVIDLRPEELSGSERIVGPCIATIPVAADLAAHADVSALLRQLQRDILASRTHAHVDADRIASSVGSGGSLFDAVFTFQSRRSPASIAPVTDINADASALSSHFPLTLSVVHDGDTAELHWSYRRDTIGDERARVLIATYVSLVEALAARLDHEPSSLDVLPPTLASILIGPPAPPSFDPLQAFLEHAEGTPDRTAVVDLDGTRHTYAALARTSGAIAGWIAARARRGDAIGVALPRSFGMIAAVLGVLRAGCHVVALDATFPAARLAWIARELRVCAVVGDRASRGLLPTSPPFLDVDAMDTPDALDALDDRAIRHGDDDAIYTVNYTSGSTGHPKLVVTTRRSHVHRLAWLRDTFPAAADDVFCFRTRLCFAPALREILEALTQGAPLAVLAEASEAAMDRFSAALARSQVTRLFLTPTFLRVLLDGGYASSFSRLRVLEISGEPAPVELVARLRRALPGVRLLNRYGATEAASVVYGDLSADDAPAGGTFSTVGAPIAGAAVAVVDALGRLVPRGCTGEIWLGGESVARGYTDPGRTAESFVERALGGAPRVRWFRTGDVGFVDPTGALFYQDRATRMIKRAGFRIEPREIEVALETHPGVARCVVVGAEAATGHRLIAFTTHTDDVPALDASEVRAHAERSLPRYMLPNDYVVLDRLPTTESGKIDWGLLLERSKKQTHIEAPPRTVTEKALLDVFRRVLRAEELGVLDEFFDVGDSLLALRIVHEVNKAFGVRLDTASLYAHPSVRVLAAHIDACLVGAGHPETRWLTFGGGPSAPRVFAFPPAGGDAHAYRPWLPHLPPLELHAMAPLTRLTPRLSLDQIAARYAAWIRELGDAPFSLVGWSLGATIAYAVACRFQAEGRTPAHLVLVDPGFNTSDYDARIDEDSLARIVHPHLEEAGVPEAERAALVTTLLEDSRLVRDYRPEPYDGSVVLVKPRDVTPSERNYEKPWNGLELFARGDLRVELTAGDHTSMMTRHAAEICRALARELGADPDARQGADT